MFENHQVFLCERNRVIWPACKMPSSRHFCAARSTDAVDRIGRPHSGQRVSRFGFLSRILFWSYWVSGRVRAFVYVLFQPRRASLHLRPKTLAPISLLSKTLARLGDLRSSEEFQGIFTDLSEGGSSPGQLSASKASIISPNPSPLFSMILFWIL